MHEKFRGRLGLLLGQLSRDVHAWTWRRRRDERVLHLRRRLHLLILCEWDLGWHRNLQFALCVHYWYRRELKRHLHRRTGRSHTEVLLRRECHLRLEVLFRHHSVYVLLWLRRQERLRLMHLLWEWLHILMVLMVLMLVVLL